MSDYLALITVVVIEVVVVVVVVVGIGPVGARLLSSVFYKKRTFAVGFSYILQKMCIFYWFFIYFLHVTKIGDRKRASFISFSYLFRTTGLTCMGNCIWGPGAPPATFKLF